ncbi:SnoaL-like domain-containing protein [Maribacter chungangensis]|uniref:SnoaL-like domain-containing protein n=1 Tax=Maribacter chungangensis TaxID=1069117 RepID=A0ABW3B9H2_9FLAO
MTTEEVARNLVRFCKEGKYPEAYDLYADDAVSMEMEGMAFGNQITKGKANILEEFVQWQNNIQEMHGGSVGEPMVAGNHFVVPMTSDVTFKEGGRMQMEELCVYEVANGKIKKAQFFYEVPPQ